MTAPRDALSQLPAIEGKLKGCIHCGVASELFAPDDRIAVGFGRADLLRDGQPVWSEDGREWEDCLTGEQAEAMAAAANNDGGSK